MDVTPLNRTLDQELMALMRGVSLECLVCGEFVVHVGRRRRSARSAAAASTRRRPSRSAVRRRQAGTPDPGYHWCAGRVTAGRQRLEESPDTAGQDAGEIPGGESRRKVAQKGDRHRRLSRCRGKGEKVG